MKKIILAMAVAAGTLPTVAAAQDSFFEPYLGVLGGREIYDSEPSHSGIPIVKHNQGGFVEAVGGIDFNLSDTFFVGVEGTVAKGVKGTVDWQYGFGSRAGIRAGNDSKFFVKAGRRWTKFDLLSNKTYNSVSYGFGVDWSAWDMGVEPSNGLSHMKVRLQAETFGNFRSVRPAAGIIAAF